MHYVNILRAQTDYAVHMQLRNPWPTRRTYHLPVSENLTQFLQAPLATPGWTCSRGWRAWRGMDVSGVATVLAYWHGIARALGLAKARDWPAIGRKWA